MIRSPIIVCTGHVDHGKTTLLDKIRGTAITKMEPGQLTQYISCSFIPINVIKNLCGELLEQFKVKIEVPGLLLIDTPGHASFLTLRKRGGSVSDVAILVVDIEEGFQEQTDESLTVLKQFKVPFVVAATKIDKIPGWFPHKDLCFLESFKKQSEDVKDELEKKLYRIVSQLAERGFNSERLDRIENFKKQIAIVPVSGITGEGVPELLVVLAGLSQQFLKGRLKVSDVARGTILEVKETKGFGVTIDVIVYDGTLRKGDYLIIGGKQPTVAKIKALLRPRPLQELRVEKQFEAVDEISAAAGIKISAPNLENVIAGSPIIAVKKENEIEEAKKLVQKEVEEVEFTKKTDGVIVKADTLGSLEAMIKILNEENIPIRKAEVGSVNRQDIIESQNVKDEIRKVVLAFNVKILEDAANLAKDLGIKIFTSDIIYRLLDEYREWCLQKKERETQEKLASLIWPAKIKVLPGYVFRESKPAIFGVEILSGKVKPKVRLLKKNGDDIGEIKEIQKEGTNIQEAMFGDKVAISIEGITIGRQVHEGDLLYVNVPEEDLKIILNEFPNKISENEMKTIEEMRKIKSK
jgi:translation initiation factor 5B